MTALMVTAWLPSLAGVTYTWTKASTYNWADNNSWSPTTGHPVAGDAVIIPAGLTVGQSSLILGLAETADAITFNINQNFYIGSSGGSLLLGNGAGSSLTQNGNSFAVLYTDVTCTSPCTLGGVGSGVVAINGNVFGNPALIVNGATYSIGTGNTGSGLTLQSITVNGGTLTIGTSNNVNVAGAVLVNNGGTLRLCNPGVVSATLNASSVTVAAGGTLYGNATINSATPTFFASGAIINPGCSPSTQSFIGGLTLSVGSMLTFELDNPGVVGSGVNDLMDVTGNLNLAGTLDVINYPNFGIGTYRLFNYTGTLTGPGLVFGTLPAGYFYSIDTTTAGQVNLIVSAPISINLVNGFNFVVNPVNGTGGNNINNTSFFQMPAGASDPNGVNNTLIYVWDCFSYHIYQYFTGFDADNYFALGGSVDGWYDATGVLASSTIWNSGQGVIIYNPAGSLVMQLAGSTPVLPIPTPLPCGCGQTNLLGNITSGPGTYENVIGLAPVEGARVLRHIAGMPATPLAPPNYEVFDYTGGAWTTTTPVLTSGEAAWFIVPCSTNSTPGSSNCCDNCVAPFPYSYTNTIYPGYNLLGINLCLGTNNTLNDILGSVPEGSQILTWNEATQSYNSPLTYYSGDWYDDNFNLVTKGLALGDGFMFYNTGGQFDLVIWGCLPDCPLPCAPTNGCQLVARHGLGLSTWTNLFSCPPPCGTTLHIWNVAQQNFATYTYQNNAWSSSTPFWGAGVSVMICVPSTPQGLNVTCPTNKTVNCGTNWSFNLPVASSCCGTNISIQSLGVVSNGPPCAQQFIQTWQITDGCNNSTTCTQIVTVVDVTGPTLSGLVNKTVPCGGPVIFDTPTVFDTCSGTNVTLTFTTTTNGTPCARAYTRTWTATDACGNTTVRTQKITIVDNTPPDIHCVSNKTVNCGAPILFDTPSVSDACNSFTLTFTTSSTGPCPKTYTRTWTAVDACGNSNSCSQTITALDNQAPIVSCPTNKIIVAKNQNCMIRIPKIRPPAKDNCTPASQLVYTQSPEAGTLVSGPCQTVTVQVKDLCNNVTTCLVEVCGQDKTPPKVTAPKSVMVTNCIVPDLLPYLTATDNCTPANKLKYKQTPPAGTTIAAGGNVVTITVTDQAGNTTTVVISLVNSGTQSFLNQLFNTGVNASKAVLPGAAADPHYTITAAPVGGPGTFVATSPSWGLPPYTASKWIAPAANTLFGYPAGTYTYQHPLFNLTGLDPATASISGRWAADDGAVMKLNNAVVSTHSTSTKDKKWTYFTINTGFSGGANMLKFEVQNLNSLFFRPTGLRVEFLNAVANCYTCTPPAVVWMTPNQTRYLNGTAVFTANVWGTPNVTYQWYRNGLPLANGGHYSGVTTPTLTITPLAYADAGLYHVSVSNPCGNLSSLRSKLTVTKKWWDVPGAAWDFADLEAPFRSSYGPDLILVNTNDLGISAGTTFDFDLPNRGGQIANVLHVPALDGDTLIQLPQVGSNIVNSYTLLMDVYRPAGSTGTNTLFNLGSSGQDGVRIVEGRDGDMIVSGTVGGQAFNLAATTPMPTGTWNRVAMVVDNPQESAEDDASLTLYVNGEHAGGITFTGTPHVPVLPGLTLDWSAGNPATLFTSPAGTSGETYVAGVQFHAAAMTAEMIAGFGDADSGPLPANQTAVGVEPVLSATRSNGQINLSWTGSAYVLQETGDLINGEWVDSGVPFEESEVNGEVLTTAHADPATEGPVKFYRLIYTP